MLASTHESIIGMIAAPATVALVPSTACTYSGTYEALPNIAQPASTPCAHATANMRSRNRLSGSTGSATWRSTLPIAWSSISGPWLTPASKPLPTLIDFAFSASLATNSS